VIGGDGVEVGGAERRPSSCVTIYESCVDIILLRNDVIIRLLLTTTRETKLRRTLRSYLRCWVCKRRVKNARVAEEVVSADLCERCDQAISQNSTEDGEERGEKQGERDESIISAKC
jgi:hypothetical protein